MSNQNLGRILKVAALFGAALAGCVNAVDKIRPNTAPEVHIVEPAPGSIVERLSSVSVRASAYDVEDGQLTDASLKWSSKEGALGTGNVINAVPALAGEEWIRVVATDAKGATATDSVRVIVQPRHFALSVTGAANTGPGLVATGDTSVSINCGVGNYAGAPVACSANYVEGSTAVMSATPQGGTFTGWSGACTGIATCAVVMSAARTVVASFLANRPPLVAIGSPIRGASFAAGSTISIAASTASDPEDGVLDGTSILWASNLFGKIGTGRAFSTSELPPGFNRISATVWDRAGLTTTDTVTILVGFRLNVTGTGSASGTIRSDTVSQPRITCAITNGAPGATGCSAIYAPGANLVLTAVPDSGLSFTGWGGACSGLAACNVSVSQATTVSAAFARRFGLSVTMAGGGSGTVASDVGGVSCVRASGANTGVCSIASDSATVVTLSATAATGSAFSGWSGACTGTSACVVTMAQSKSTTATFVKRFALSVQGAGSGAGGVASDVGGVNCSTTVAVATGSCSVSADSATVITLTATASSGSAFTGWSGACTGTGTCQTTMSQARSVTATFVRQFTVSLAGAGSGAGSVTSDVGGVSCAVAVAVATGTCAATLDSSAVVTLTATPTSGSRFSGWSGVCSGTGTCQTTMSQARSVTATFVRQFTVSLAGAGSGTGSVTSDVGGVSCAVAVAVATGTCAATLDSSTVITLTAIVNAGSRFAGWSGACSGTGACSVSMTQARAVSAAFAVASTATVTVSPGGATLTSTQMLTAAAKDSSGSTIVGKTFTWASLNTSVATINNSTGVATAVGSGQVTISASVDGKVGYATLSVAVATSPVNMWVATQVTTLGSLNVWGASDAAVFVAGSYPSGSEVFKFNGASWSKVYSGSGNNFVDVWGSSAADVWTTGNSGAYAHLSGASWSAVANPGCQMFQLWGADPNNVFSSCNGTATARYDGSSWSFTSAPPCTVSDLYGFAASDVWGVCGATNAVVRYDGSAWQSVQTFSGTTLESVWGTGPTDVWVIGEGGLVRRWNGTSWTTPGTPPAGVSFRRIWGANDNDVYVTESSGSGRVFHFDGTTWSQSMAESGGLDQIWGTPTSVWVAGNGSGNVWRGYRGASLAVSPSAPSMVVGNTQQLTAVAKDASNATIAGATLTWSSNNTALATVSTSGVVTALGAGNATITATAIGGVSASSLVTVSAFVTADCQTGPLTGLANCWSLDGTLQDFLGNTGGTLVATATLGHRNDAGGALLFRQSGDYASVPMQPAFTVSAAASFSVTAWFRLDQAPGAGQSSFVTWAGTPGVFAYSIAVEPGGLISSVDGASTGSSTPFASIATGSWHHVVLVYDQSQAKVFQYLDGSLTGSGAYVSGPGVGNTQVTFGGYAGIAQWAFKGAVDEVRQYSRALSASEVATLAGTTVAANLAFQVQPSSVLVGSAVSPAIKVAIQDAGGSTVTSATNSVTLAIATNAGGGTLGGTLTAAAVNGVATFSNITLSEGGNGYTLTASAASLTSATSGAFNVTGPADFVASYPMDGTANDVSGNALNGTLFGGTLVANRLGTANKATRFTATGNGAAADEGLVVPHNNLLADNSMTELTLIAWIKTTNATGFANGRQRLVAKGRDFQFNYSLHLQDGKPSMLAWASAGAASLQTTGPTSVADGNWHMLVGTIVNNAEARIYVDGVLVASSTTVQNAWNLTGTGPLAIGRYPYNTGDPSETTDEPYDGTIDDVRIFRRALSAVEIRALYNTEH